MDILTSGFNPYIFCLQFHKKAINLNTFPASEYALVSHYGKAVGLINTVIPGLSPYIFCL